MKCKNQVLFIKNTELSAQYFNLFTFDFQNDKHLCPHTT